MVNGNGMEGRIYEGKGNVIVYLIVVAALLLGFLVEGHEGVLGGAGEIRAAEEGEQLVATHRDGKVGLGGCDEPGNRAAEGGVVVTCGTLVEGGGGSGAAAVGAACTGAACKAVGADAAAGFVHDYAGATICAGVGMLAVG